MGEGYTELDARLEAVAKAAAPLGSRLPRVRDPATGRWIAHWLDALLRNASIGLGPLDLAIGEGLEALTVGRRAMDLRYSNIGDYAREELGINASTAVKMARLARKLHERSILRDAVRCGEVTARKAEIIAPVAVRENQVRWILRAKAETVRSLKAALQMPPDPDDEEWVNLSTEVRPEKQPLLDETLRLPGVVLCATSTKMQRVNAWGQEYLGSHPAPPDQQADDVLFAAEDGVDALQKRLEEENRHWADLEAVDPVKPEEFSGEIDPWRIDAELKRLVAKRGRWDEVFGRVAMLFKWSRAWEPLGFASFGHYCEERLGMADRTVAQRVALEHSLHRQPVLRRALREKRISYEKARVISRHAEGEEVEIWVERAETMTCVQLRRAMQGKQEAQMCARGNFSVWMTVSVADVVKAAFRAARAAAKRWLAAGESLVMVAEHFTETWRAQLKAPKTVQQRTRARDAHFCQVPGCSRAAVHAHHIISRSQGGTDDPWNLISLCAAHHLHGIHGAACASVAPRRTISPGSSDCGAATWPSREKWRSGPKTQRGLTGRVPRSSVRRDPGDYDSRRRTMVPNRLCIATATILAGLGCTPEQRTPSVTTSRAEMRAAPSPTVTPQETGTTQRFFAVSPVNAAVAWASARGGTFARTLDGGRTWVSRQVAGAETMEFRDVEGVSANVAFLMSAGAGPDNRIYKTEDGGNSWRLQAQAADPRDFWDCFAFWTPRRAILMDDSYDARFPLRHTSNGGNDGWPLLRNPPAAQPGEAAFAASGTCAATEGESNAWLATGGAPVARVLRTTDAGRSWQSSATPIQPQGTPTSGNASVDFRDARRGLVGGGDVVDSATQQLNVARSRDGGASWRLTTPTPFPGAVYGLTYARNHHEDDDGDDDDDRDGDNVRKRAVATGPGGSAWTNDEGDTWTLLPGITNCWAVAFATERTGWLGCGAGRIYRIDF